MLLEAAPKRKPRKSAAEQTVSSVYAKHQKKFLTNSRFASRELRKITRRYLRDIDTIMRQTLKGGPPYTPAMLSIVDARIKTLTNKFAANMVSYFQNQIVTTSQLAELREIEVALKSYAGGLPKPLEALFANPFPKGKLAERVLAILEDTSLGTRVSLSSRLWRLNTYTNSRVSLVVGKGLEQGLHPFQVSKLLEKELVPRAGGVGKVWGKTNAPRQLGKIIGTVPSGFATRAGTVAFNYQRLARTEMFAAQRATHLITIARMNALPKKINPVRGVRWNLSLSHPQLDICDDWAQQDIDGLGAGVYLPQNVPMGHAQDLCVTSTAMVTPATFHRNMRNFLTDENMSASDFGKLMQVQGADYVSPSMQRILGNATMLGQWDGLNSVNDGLRFGFG